jgi:predicted small metal-binding protein
VAVEKVLVCDCGFEARASDDEALIEQIRRHAAEAHGMTLSHDQALQLTVTREPTSRNEKEER